MFASNELSSTIDGYLGQQDESSAFDAVCQSLDEAIEGLDKFVAESDGISTDQIKKIVFLSEKMLFARDKASAQYEKGNAWSDDTFLSAKTAIMWESHIGIHQADKSIRRGELLNNYPVIEEAAKAGLITTDHITSLLRIADDDKYHDHFVSDIDQIIGNASVLPASQFSLVVTMWKHSINELLGESSIEYEAFKERYLDVYQTAEGYWIVDGKLDQMNGSLFHKALKDINNKKQSLAELVKSKKITALIFYSPSCPHCIDFFKELFPIYSANKDKLGIYTISTADETAIKDFNKTNGYNWINTTYKPTKEYNPYTDYVVLSTPTIVLIDSNMKIVSRFTNLETIKELLNK